MICNVVICTHYRLLWQIDTVTQKYHGDYTVGNDYTLPMAMFEKDKMYEMLNIMQYVDPFWK